MAQSSTLSSSAPSTASDSRNSSLSPTTSNSTSCFPEGLSKSLTRQSEPPQFPERSLGDLLSSNQSRRFSDSHKHSHGATDMIACQKEHSQHSTISAPAGRGEEEEEEEEERRTVIKRHLHHSHTNVYTECGRHCDDWLFGGFSVTKTVKRMFGRRQYRRIETD
jgi:hypothetical protein